MKIFILEDDPERIRYFRELFYADHTVDVASSCVEVDKFQPPYDLILLDHDLGRRQMAEHEDCGLTFVRLVKDKLTKDDLVIVHSYNHDGAVNMIMEIQDRVMFCDHFPFRGPRFNAAVEMFMRSAKLRKNLDASKSD